MNGDWGTHYNKLKEKKFPPSATLLKALALFKSENLSTKYAIEPVSIQWNCWKKAGK